MPQMRRIHKGAMEVRDGMAKFSYFMRLSDVILYEGVTKLRS